MGTQYQQVTAHLTDKTFIDARIARELYGVQCLSKIISRLRKVVMVRTERQLWVDPATGKPGSFARYHIGNILGGL